MMDNNNQSGMPDFLKRLRDLMTPKKKGKNLPPVVPDKPNPLGRSGTPFGGVGRYGAGYKGDWSGMNRGY